MRAAAAICPQGGGGGAPGPACYATGLSPRLFPINRLFPLLLRCRPDASRTYGSTLKETLVFHSLTAVCACACVRVCAQHVNDDHQRSRWCKPRWLTDTACMVERTEVFISGDGCDVIHRLQSENETMEAGAP